VFKDLNEKHVDCFNKLSRLFARRRADEEKSGAATKERSCALGLGLLFDGGDPAYSHPIS
jgi:hypothetical protein